MLEETNLDLPPAAVLGPKLQGLEPAHIIWVVEHPPHRRLLLVHSDRVA